MGGPTLTRGQKLWNSLRPLRNNAKVSIERAWLYTQAYKENEGSHLYIRRALALKKVLNDIPIYIDDLQLLAGDFSVRPMTAEWFPELVIQWVRDYIDNGLYENAGPDDYSFESGRKDQIIEICDFWGKKAAKESFYNFIGEDNVRHLYTLNEEGSWVYAATAESQTEKGWNIPDYSRVLKHGFRGLIQHIDAKLADLKILDSESLDRYAFLTGLKISLEAGIVYATRYSKLAAEMASTETDPNRKQELLNIAQICSKVPECPAETFQEAMQSMLFAHLIVYWDSRTYGLGFGRVDQFLYPYYKNDIDNGFITDEYAIEILECFRVKLMGKRNLLPMTLRNAVTSEPHFHNCVLGGQTVDGKDAVNKLSFLWLEAAERTRTPHPTLSVRWHPQLDMEFAMAAAKLCSKGMGFPAWFNDKASMEFLLSKGCSLEEARDYAVGGCVLANVVGKTAPTWPSILNMGKVLEVAMHGGVDPRLGNRAAPCLGNFEESETYQDFYAAVKSYIKYFAEYTCDYVNKCSVWRLRVMPDIVLSALFDDCIEKGKSIMADGAKYAFGAHYLIPVGVVDMANSLYVIKKLVFDDGKIQKQALMEALSSDFVGYEDMLKLVRSAPKFGNDIDEVDHLVKDIYDFLCKCINSIPAAFGGTYELAPHSIAFHANMGARVGALPSGRLAGVSLADGAVSPCQGTDTNGPTAVINSAGKIDHVPIFGTLFNMKFMPSTLKTDSDFMNLLALIRTYFEEYNGKHIQFNVVDRDTLIDAKEHPSNYPDLIVRVAGYSALWCELNEGVHNELIARTENSFG